MSLRSIAQLKTWFKRGLYPTAAQFADWMDSYWHKEEKMPISSVDNLSAQLNSKYAKTDGVELERKHEQLVNDFNTHEVAADEKFDSIYTHIGELESEDVKIWADIATIHEDVTELQAEVIDLHDKDTELQTSLTNAHADLDTIREIMKDEATLTEAKAALVALGSNYKDLYGIACTLKEFKTAGNPMAGRYWDETSSTPTAAGYYGSLTALKALPKKLGLGRYLVTDDRVRRKLDPTDSTRFEDGSTAALDGTMGQCMWCWNSHYFTSWKEGDNLVEVITFLPIDGQESMFVPAGGISWLSGGVYDNVDEKLCSLISTDERYRGGRFGVLNNSNLADDAPQKTMLGMVKNGLPQDSYSTYARKRGVGWEANWFVARAVVEYSLRIIFGSRDSQAAYNPDLDANGLLQGGLGMGVTQMPNWVNYNSCEPIIPTFVGVEMGDGTGVIDYNVTQGDGTSVYVAPVPVFFGLVNPFGHLWSVIGGMIIDVNTKALAYIATSLYQPFNSTPFDWLFLAAELAREGPFNGIFYTKRYSTNFLCGLPTEAGGTIASYFCDGNHMNWEPSPRLRRCYVGGASNGEFTAGAFSKSIGVSAMTFDAATSPLCYFEQEPFMV